MRTSNYLSVAVILILAGCGRAPQAAWEDGVFWGATATRSGAGASDVLERAYEAKAVAGQRVKAKKKRLAKYRRGSWWK